MKIIIKNRKKEPKRQQDKTMMKNLIGPKKNEYVKKKQNENIIT